MSVYDDFFKPYFASGALRPCDGSVWVIHNGTNPDTDYEWKMHVAAYDVADWLRVAGTIMPWMIQNGVTFKTISPDDFSVERILSPTCCQYAKAFTIYPTSAPEFAKIACGLDALMCGAKLQTETKLTAGHNMSYEHTLGHSGRIFYRMERDGMGRYMSTERAYRLNPACPYNPLNVPDPFANLFARVAPAHTR